MTRYLAAFAALSIALPGSGFAADVKVDGADVKYPTSVEVDGHSLRLTGTGLRKKFVFNVYTIASYVGADEKPRSAAQLSALDAPKRLHLVMERGVDGKTMADAFKEAIAKNYDLAPMAKQVEQLSAYLKAAKANDNDHIIFDHLPGKGVRISRTGKAPVVIEGMGFAKAVWDIYFGKENVSGDIKKGLLSGL